MLAFLYAYFVAFLAMLAAMVGVTLMPDLSVPVQRIRAFVRDHMLEPDAMRGSEHFLRNINDGEGNAIIPVDEEEARRQWQADATQSRAPIRVNSSSSLNAEAPAIPVMEAPPASPNVQRVPLVADVRTPPVVTDPGVDWQAKARAEGWAPASETPERSVSVQHGFPPSDAPVEADSDFRPSPGQPHPLDATPPPPPPTGV